jgi:hypothetical protein
MSSDLFPTWRRRPTDTGLRRNDTPDADAAPMRGNNSARANSSMRLSSPVAVEKVGSRDSGETATACMPLDHDGANR